MNVLLLAESKEEAGNIIYTRFLTENAIWQVNISGNVLIKYQALNWTDPTLYVINLFDEAEEEVLTLLRCC
jgi:hypothetical protein